MICLTPLMSSTRTIWAQDALVKEMGHSGNSSGTQRESEGKLMLLLVVLQEQNQKGELPTQKGIPIYKS